MYSGCDVQQQQAVCASTNAGGGLSIGLHPEAGIQACCCTAAVKQAQPTNAGWGVTGSMFSILNSEQQSPSSCQARLCSLLHSPNQAITCHEAHVERSPHHCFSLSTDSLVRLFSLLLPATCGVWGFGRNAGLYAHPCMLCFNLCLPCGSCQPVTRQFGDPSNAFDNKSTWPSSCSHAHLRQPPPHPPPCFCIEAHLNIPKAYPATHAALVAPARETSSQASQCNFQSKDSGGLTSSRYIRCQLGENAPGIHPAHTPNPQLCATWHIKQLG